MHSERTTDLYEAMRAVIGEDIHPMANLANAAALLFDSLDRLNWAGFYLLHKGALWLGPFQGKVACTRIAIGKGVCGTAFERNERILVPDVHAFPGHIACDAASRSEIVVPLRKEGRPVGVLDLDSPHLSRFTEEDGALLSSIAELLSARCDFASLGYDLT